MSLAASQASSVNVAAPDEDELAQSKKDYSFRLFENGQLVGSAALDQQQTEQYQAQSPAYHPVLLW